MPKVLPRDLPGESLSVSHVVHPLLAAADALAERLDALRFAEPVTHVYNTFRYARAPYATYCERFGGDGTAPREALLLGINPGPWGMAQTGVPFGEVALVRDWMGIEARVERPHGEHPKRPVEGFACARSEVSGARLWGWARERYGTAERFFARFFAANYCPLIFLEATGRNRTPDKLPAAERAAVEAACDAHLAALLRHLRPRLALGVGAYAEANLARVVGRMAAAGAPAGGVPRVGRILHPSPASPAANRGWAAAAEKQFRALGVELPE